MAGPSTWLCGSRHVLEYRCTQGNDLCLSGAYLELTVANPWSSSTYSHNIVRRTLRECGTVNFEGACYFRDEKEVNEEQTVHGLLSVGVVDDAV